MILQTLRNAVKNKIFVFLFALHMTFNKPPYKKSGGDNSNLHKASFNKIIIQLPTCLVTSLTSERGKSEVKQKRKG